MGKQGHNQLTDVDVFSKGLLHTNETLDEDMDKYNDIQVKDNDNNKVTTPDIAVSKLDKEKIEMESFKLSESITNKSFGLQTMLALQKL